MVAGQAKCGSTLLLQLMRRRPALQRGDDMIDHNMAFVDEVDAIADEVVGQYYVPPTETSAGGWNQSCSFGTLIWDPADDTTEIVPGPDGDREVIVHHPIDDQFRITIALAEPSEDLINHRQLELAVDHEDGAILGTSFTDPQLGSLHMQPVFAGSAYPFLSGDGGLVAQEAKMAYFPRDGAA